VASFPVLGMMTEALDFEPDLVVVYTGHNEVFGTYGVASVGWAGGKPWRLGVTRFLHSLALVQAGEKIVASKPPAGNITLMERMVGSAYVAPADWRRKAAANNLYHNVLEMIVRCQARGVPVLVCTQPSNERNLAPIGQDKFPELSEGQRRRFAEHFNSANFLLATNPSLAVPAFQAALAESPSHSRAHFQLGSALHALGRNTEAQAEFAAARDLDPMPWRAISTANESIRRATQERGAKLCDLEAVFRKHSSGESIGWELMDDHVHPTLRGQALIAEAIVDSLNSCAGRLTISSDERDRIVDWRAYAQRLGDNKYDRYAVAHMMRVIFDVPFMRESNPGAFARFNQIAGDIESAETAEIQLAMREYQGARPHAGSKRPITAIVARVMMQRKEFTEALELYEIAQCSVPQYTSWYLEYVYFALVCKEKLNGALTSEERGRAMDAIEQGMVLMQRGYSETGFTERHLGRLHQLRGEFATAIPFLQVSRRKLGGMDLVAADQALIVSLIRTGRLKEAEKLALLGSEQAGRYAPMYLNMLKELDAIHSTNSPVFRR
jgi:tetratricopeptide (TPR) repeat protein